jgi:hypothetical protein
MKINNKYTGQTRFDDLNIGDVFLWGVNHFVCMKINDVEIDNEYNNVVDLAIGNTFFIPSGNFVTKVSAELIIDNIREV